MTGKGDKIREAAERRREILYQAFAAGLEKAAAQMVQAAADVANPGVSRRRSLQDVAIVNGEIRQILGELDRLNRKEATNA